MNWNRFKDHYLSCPEVGMALDISRIDFPVSFPEMMKPALEKAFRFMDELEGGAIANPDEDRMVGHYWLRNPDLAPTPEISRMIRSTLEDLKAFASRVHSGSIRGNQGPFNQLLIIGIGGSALGPQFVSQALTHPDRDKMDIAFLDNTDPDGIDLTLKTLKSRFGQTLVVVISKSGGTAETRNGMLETQAAFDAAGIDFASRAVAITGEGSKLNRLAQKEKWLARFPMWDWIGGRTSETGAVGLLPAALQGFDVDAMLSGAKAMDALTRRHDLRRNPAALMALMWHFATDGRGSKDMVILPYKDRLQLFSRYLQQLVMESLGKELDLDGNTVNQGISVYGNKGSTDQHAYVQQLREGVLNFFVIFIEVLRERESDSPEVGEGVTSGDYLNGFYLGTREALHEKQRQSISITVDQVNARSVGALIALFERAVGLYAHLIHINAYHQPGVEAGKKAAGSVLELQNKLMETLRNNPGKSYTAEELARELSLESHTEWVFKCLSRLGYNQRIHAQCDSIPCPVDTAFSHPEHEPPNPNE